MNKLINTLAGRERNIRKYTVQHTPPHPLSHTHLHTDKRFNTHTYGKKILKLQSGIIFSFIYHQLTTPIQKRLGKYGNAIKMYLHLNLRINPKYLMF